MVVYWLTSTNTYQFEVIVRKNILLKMMRLLASLLYNYTIQFLENTLHIIATAITFSFPTSSVRSSLLFTKLIVETNRERAGIPTVKKLVEERRRTTDTTKAHRLRNISHVEYNATFSFHHRFTNSQTIHKEIETLSLCVDHRCTVVEHHLDTEASG